MWLRDNVSNRCMTREALFDFKLRTRGYVLMSGLVECWLQRVHDSVLWKNGNGRAKSQRNKTKLCNINEPERAPDARYIYQPFIIMFMWAYLIDGTLNDNSAVVSLKLWEINLPSYQLKFFTFHPATGLPLPVEVQWEARWKYFCHTIPIWCHEVKAEQVRVKNSRTNISLSCF